MPEIQRVSTGNPWEREIGFSRAVRCGNLIFTAGTIAVDKHGVTMGEDCYEQCTYILDKLRGVIAGLGGRLENTLKVTCFLVSLADAPGFTRAHAEIFGDVKPATTCVQAAGLFGDGTLVELELVVAAD